MQSIAQIDSEHSEDTRPDTQLFLRVSKTAKFLKEHLEAMAYSKMNVLHWHIVDDQSFPFVSRELPSLAREGAFSADAVYEPQDVQELVSYAKDLGIRIIPEFDTPGRDTETWHRFDILPLGIYTVSVVW